VRLGDQEAGFRPVTVPDRWSHRAAGQPVAAQQFRELASEVQRIVVIERDDIQLRTRGDSPDIPLVSSGSRVVVLWRTGGRATGRIVTTYRK
jgi:hypothetical protein